jgi:hypothetical protein
MGISPRKKSANDSPSKSDIWKLIASIISALFAFINFYFGDNGNAVAFATASIILIADLYRYNYSSILFKLFTDGGNIVRYLLLIITIGGTLLCIKIYAEISLIPPYLDTAIKRIGPALVIIALIMFFTSVISDAITHTNSIVKDEHVTKYAPIMYLTAFLLCSEIIVLFSGLKILDDFGSCKSLDQDRLKICLEDKDKYKITNWEPRFISFQLMIIAITAIWYVYSISCIFARTVEYYFKERLHRTK